MKPKGPRMPLQDHLKAIGRSLVAQRTSLDPARHRSRKGWMAVVSSETTLSKRIIIDIETGARDNYSPDTVAVLENLYRLRRGSLRDALNGAGPLVTEDGRLLVDVDADPSSQRYVTEERRSRLSGRVWQIVRDLEADTEGIPEEEAEEMIQRAMANAEAQARLMLESERRRWERQQSIADQELKTTEDQV